MLSEPELARYQTLQKGNNCTLHAISSALGMLGVHHQDPQALANEVNRLWWRGRFYRLAPGWGVTPPMQAKIVNYLARKYDLPVSARVLHLSPEILHIMPYGDSFVTLVTIYWLPRQAPALYLGDTARNYNATKKAGGHTMLFASYDPDHQSGTDLLTPWGFINSWAAGGDVLFWMENKQFKKAWSFPLPHWGKNAAVVITRKDA